MFGLFRKNGARDVVDVLHERVVAQSRQPALYAPGLLPDTVDGRFESLALHVLLVLRRLRALPHPADDVAQDLVDKVFAHLEVALREIGVGDFGVPKRMKKIAGAFYDRTRLYDPPIEAEDADSLAGEIASHLQLERGPLLPFARYCLAGERELAVQDLEALLRSPRFAALPFAAAAETTS